MNRNCIFSMIALFQLVSFATGQSLPADSVRSAVAGLGSLSSLADRDYFPVFSWDRVPLYMHIRKDTAFTSDEIRYLATFPLVTLEKGTGYREFASTEEGTLVAARAIKAVNPATKVLYYRNVIVHYDGYSANRSLANISGAFLMDGEGNVNLVRNRRPAYDLGNAHVRDWWVANARQICADPAVDGLFLDGNIKVLEPNYLRDKLGEKKKTELIAGYDVMVKYARQVLGPETLMVANILRARLPDAGISRLHVFDGSYIECFEGTVGKIAVKDYVAKGISAFQEAARQGLIIAFTAGLGEEMENGHGNPESTDEMRRALADDAGAERRFTYLLAMFLVCAEKYSYFCMHDGYDTQSSKVWMEQPAEFDRPLGEPSGPAIRSGYVYIREFEHVSVLLDIEHQTGVVTWKD